MLKRPGDPVATLDDRSAKRQTQPGKVMFMYGLGPQNTQEGIEVAIQPFCRTAAPKVFVAANRQNAFIEFGSVDECTDAINSIQNGACHVNGMQVNATYSTRSEVTLPAQQMTLSTQMAVENGTQRTVLASISNFQSKPSLSALDLVFVIFSKSCGPVDKIIVFHGKKDMAASIQALIQFANPQSARRAFTLNGQSLTNQQPVNMMSVVYSSNQELDVKSNSETSWDFTNPDLERGQGRPVGTHGNLHANNSPAPQPAGFAQPAVSGFQAQGNPTLSQPATTRPQLLVTPQPAVGFQPQLSVVPGVPGDASFGNIVIVYKIPERLTVDNLFNLFSIYGYIDKIKFLHNKPDSALVQYRLAEYAALAVDKLKQTPISDAVCLEVQPSKATDIKIAPTEAPEKARQFEGRDQRWPLNAHDRILRAASQPTNTLHISFLAKDCTQDEIVQVLQQVAVVQDFSFLPKAGDKFNMALATLPTVAETTQAVLLLNGTMLHGMKLKFAYSRQKTVTQAAMTAEI